MNFNGATSRQSEAVNTKANRVLAVAGPGSGKTRTLIWRMQRLIMEGTIPGRITAITFTNAAADEITNRLDGVKLDYCGTLHGYVLRMLNRHGDLTGFTGKLSVMDEAAGEEFLKDRIAFSQVKGTRKDIDAEIAKGPPLKPQTPIALFVFDYYQTMKRINMVTYDALLWFGYQLVSKVKDITENMIFAREDYLFVDEFQDSGDLDVLIYNALPIANKFFVGDCDQAIYGFRGGNVHHINRMSEDPEIRVIPLEHNFRCAPEICDAAQSLIERNKDRFPKVTLSATEYDGEVQLQQWHDQHAELAGLQLALQTAHMDGRDLNDVAILFRTNALVDYYAKIIGQQFPIRKKKYQQMPPDWGKCLLLLSLLVDPRNDYLATKWVQAKDGLDIARKASMRCLKEKRSINSIFLFLTEPPADQIGPALAKQGISVESILHVEAMQKKIGGTLSDLLLHIRSGELHKEEIGDGVTITTLHSSKGREWGTVYLPALEDHILPGEGKNVNLEEERRLLFVGMTRAKRKLVMSWAEMRPRQWGARGSVQSAPSRFLQEIKM